MNKETRRAAYQRRFFLEPFLDFLKLERGLRAGTVASYRSDVARFLRFAEETSVDAPRDLGNARILHEYVARMGEEGLSPTSIRRAQSALRAYFAFLSDESIVAENPSDRMDRPKIPRRLPSFLTQDEAARLVGAVDLDSPMHWRDRAALELLYATGMRVSELTGLILPRLDLAHGDCLVLGKGGKERLVPVGRIACEALDRYLVGVRPRLDKGRSRGAVFLNQRGTPLSRTSVWTIVARAAAGAGIQRKVSPHTLRHSCATHLLEGGADLVAVQELLGHAHVATTQIYTHLDRDHLRRVHSRCHPRSR